MPKKKALKKRKKELKSDLVDDQAMSSWHAELSPETKKSIFTILSFVIAALFVLSYIGQGGVAGQKLFRALDFLLGSGYILAPLILVLVGFSFLFSGPKKIVTAIVFGGILFLIGSLASLNIIFGQDMGGFLGALLSVPLLRFFDFWASLIIILGLMITSVLFMLNVPLWKQKDDSGKDSSTEDESDVENANTEEKAGAAVEVLKSIGAALQQKKSGEDIEEEKEQAPANAFAAADKEESSIAIRKMVKKFKYTKPPLELLQNDRGKPSSGDIRANANIIKRTLENFGIEVDMDEVSVGPTVTQYTLKPAEGVKLARIIALHNDLSLALAAHPLRIEAPIPGRSLVGIEVPNRSIALVGLKMLLEHDLFAKATQPLLFVLGRDVTGSPVFADLAKMPHLLLSGSTGSGKSVNVHTIITSFLYRNPPEILRFIIIDPKRVELSVYNDIPHLLTPVITDSKKTIQALRWATKEMDRRYDLLSRYHARDIVTYNAEVGKLGAAGLEKSESGSKNEMELLPYIIIIIDELADLMATYPREMEGSIVRIAQMARAVGIHLIVATQRPSVEVITGLIKANITSRIAFQVASQIDSRTILDTAGAEKLLGNGDMLFLAGDSGKPKRIQGAFISEQEVKRVVGFLRDEGEAPEYDEDIFTAKIEEEEGVKDDMENEDPMYDEAREVVIQAGKASASYLQRRLRVGYARAARLLDIMEARGIIGPADGAKPRDILVEKEKGESDVMES